MNTTLFNNIDFVPALSVSGSVVVSVSVAVIIISIIIIINNVIIITSSGAA